MDKQKPQIFIKTIIFNDGTQLSLNHNSIIVFTGANNCGKSQVLKDVETSVKKEQTVVIQSADFECIGDIDHQKFLDSRFYLDDSGRYHPYESSLPYRIEDINAFWRNHQFYGDLFKIFIKRLSTELRLTASNSLERSHGNYWHPIYKINKSEALAQQISAFFHQAFGVDLILNRNGFDKLPFHVGNAPDKKNITIDKQDDYYNLVEQMPELQKQGDGMRSFASILLDTFTSEYTVTLIDEPEAFLHPPQARILGKMLAKNNPDSRQLLISTHSEDFLQGLLDADSENVAVIRIDRKENINNINILNNDDIKKLWGNPILRYSNILSGLFHEKVVVCESDYDCLFYQALINAIYERKKEIAPDILFTHCGGKARVKDVVAALKAVNVPVVAICDFDLINSSQVFKPLAESFGLEWEKELFPNMKIIYDIMNKKNSSSNNAWEQIKKIGKQGFTGEAPSAYEKVEAVCKSAGLFVVPVGEMECFDKTINKEKKEWVYTVLESYDLANETKLNSARSFVQEIVDY